MTCARCADLEEQISYYKSELGLQSDVTANARLSKALGQTPGACKMLYALYLARGRVVSNWSLLELLKPESDESRLPSVYACRLRKSLGPDSVINAWGEGWRLSAAATERVAEILSAAD